ncbi:MAG: hypothetical protein E7227_07945 [Clostridiales bacterium]|nr:hypothetical protein [Clostridiales bacterium]
MKQVEAETEEKIITDPAEVPEEIVSTLESEEEIEQIGKDIVVGRKTVDYEDALPSADEARRQQAMEAWENYNRPEPDPSDGVLKP